MSRRSIQLLCFLLIALSPLATFAQKPSANRNDRLLESGSAAKVPAAAAVPAEIKIVSYNIRWRGAEELEQIIDWLKSSEAPPKIIGLQEVDRAKQRTGKINNARALAEGLGMYYAWAAPPLPKDSKEEEETGVALLSPYPLTAVTRIVLPHKGPGGRWRVALGATVTIGKVAVRVYSVHSETRISVSKKMGQLRAVLDDLERFPKTMPVAVMGDFNSWEPAAKKGVRKLFEESSFATPFPDDQTTFRRKLLVVDLKLKLDWIWVRGLSVKSSGIERGLKVSDHFPLWTVVKVESTSVGR